MSDERGTGAEAVQSLGVDLHRRIDRIAVIVVVLSRLTVLGMVALSVATGVESHSYTNAPLAAGVYTAVVGYGLLLSTLAVRRPAVPAWALFADVAVMCAGATMLTFAAPARFFASWRTRISNRSSWRSQ